MVFFPLLALVAVERVVARRSRALAIAVAARVRANVMDGTE
jgi:hypothetical protein